MNRRRNMSLSGFVWAERMDNRFVVRGYNAERKISNDILGKFADLEEATALASTIPGARVINRLSDQVVFTSGMGGAQ